MDKAKLKEFIDRILPLEEEKKGLSDDIRDIKAEAKAAGFDPKVITAVVRLLKIEKEERKEQLGEIEQYLEAYEG